jgi:hypothetical protein
MNDPHAFLEDRDALDGPMREEIPCRKKKCRKENHEKVTDRGFGSKSFRAKVARNKISGNLEKYESHPVSESLLQEKAKAEKKRGSTLAVRAVHNPESRSGRYHSK